MIKHIYRKTFKLSERSMHNDKIYRREKNRAKQCYQFLSENLSESNLHMLDRLLYFYDKKTERQHEHCFESGFKTGVAVAIKSLE